MTKTKTEDLPKFHYFRRPYPILSFTFGLYCNAPWSKTEFEKWENSELKDGPRKGEYEYYGYLTPYPGIDPVAKHVISEEISKNEPNPTTHRRNPTRDNVETIWPLLCSELLLEPFARNPDAKSPYFFSERPVLSALACIYLMDASSVHQIAGAFAADSAGEPLLPNDVFTRLIRNRPIPSNNDANPGLLEDAIEGLKPYLIAELTKPEECW